MQNDWIVEIRIGRRTLIILSLILTLFLAFLILPDRIQAQKAQESYKDKFKIASENGGVGIAVSSDGKFVYAIGPAGILVSDDFGKTGSWVQTAILK
jgi:hypothetical protein